MARYVRNSRIEAPWMFPKHFFTLENPEEHGEFQLVHTPIGRELFLASHFYVREWYYFLPVAGENPTLKNLIWRGYVFVFASDLMLQQLKRETFTSRIVSTWFKLEGVTPRAIQEIMNHPELLQTLESNTTPQVEPTSLLGRKVRIDSGPFKTMNGEIVAETSSRVTVQFSILGRTMNDFFNREDVVLL